LDIGQLCRSVSPPQLRVGCHGHCDLSQTIDLWRRVSWRSRRRRNDASLGDRADRLLAIFVRASDCDAPPLPLPLTRNDGVDPDRRPDRSLYPGHDAGADSILTNSRSAIATRPALRRKIHSHLEGCLLSQVRSGSPSSIQPTRQAARQPPDSHPHDLGLSPSEQTARANRKHNSGPGWQLQLR